MLEASRIHTIKTRQECSFDLEFIYLAVPIHMHHDDIRIMFGKMMTIVREVALFLGYPHHTHKTKTSFHRCSKALTEVFSYEHKHSFSL